MVTSNSRIHLLALDVDGTLLTNDHAISPASRSAIQALTGRGIRVVLASARSPYTLRPILAELDLEGFVIAFSGGLLCRLSHDPARLIEIITERRLPLASAQTIVRLALSRGISVGWFVGEAWHIQAWDDTLRREASIIGMPFIAKAPLASMSEAPHKIQCMVAGADRAAELHRLRDELPADCLGQFTHETYLEIFPQGVNKADGLQLLGSQLGIELHEMAAIGDGENDIKMLQAVGLGIAMGHAPDSVRQVAAWTTSSNDEDGVALAIERIRREGRV